ncbi:MAG TPA: CHASE domain-containing protein [Phycisphaerae bacterium]|nr:CHASE domain-containing protein [Phycisphaerae bacterium]
MEKWRSTCRALLEIIVVGGATTTAIYLVNPLLASQYDPAVVSTIEAIALVLIAGPIVIWRIHAAFQRLQRDRLAAGGRHRLSTFSTPFAVLLTGLAFTTTASIGARRGVQLEARAYFDRLVERIATEIQQRSNQVIYGLNGARGVFAASKHVDRSEFRAYVASRDLPHEFPGANGFGFVQHVRRAELDAFIVEEREDGAPDFQIRTVAPDVPGARPIIASDLYVIKHIYPIETNREAWGLDIGSDAIRREGIERAVRTGRPAITGRIQLVQDAKRRSGFLYFVPIYRNGGDVSTEKAREAAIFGLVYAPIILEKTLAGLYESASREIDFEVFDGAAAIEDAELFSSVGRFDMTERPLASSMFSEFVFIPVGGRMWTIRTRTTPAFEAMVDYSVPILIGVGGGVLSVMLSLVVFALMTSRTRALRMAHEMTADLAMAKAAAEDALRDARAFRTALDQHSIISVADADGRILDVNEPFCRISGYSRDELIGRDHRLLKSGVHSSEFWADLWGTLLAGRAWHGEMCNRHKDGSLYWVDSIIAPFREADGSINCFVSIRNDITERKRADAALQQLASRLALAVRAGGVGIWDFDVISQQLIWDDQMHRLYGLGETRLKDALEAWRRSIHPDDRARVEAEIDAAVRGEREFDTEFRIVWADGSIHDIRALAVVEHDADRRPCRLVGTNWDITSQKRAEARLRDVNRSLEAATARANSLANEARELATKADNANTAKSEFLANMSHEIRTPMTAILGFAELMAENIADNCVDDIDDWSESISTIKRNGEHLLRIINDILDLSKIEAHKMTVENIVCSPNDIVADVTSLMRVRANEKQLAFHTKVLGEIPRTIATDPVRLRQILINLLGNAIKFTDAGDVRLEVQYVADKDGPRLQFNVMDTGIGMTPEQTERIFQPFTQADNTTTRQFGGTGLGLTISKRLAQLLGGDIDLVRSEVGAGTEYRVTIRTGAIDGADPAAVHPVVVSASTDVSPAPALSPDLGAARPKPLTGSRVLLAEDGPDNRRLISLHLRNAGAEVTTVDNGRIAMEEIDAAQGGARPFDLLVTDMQMPEMDGYALARALRSKGVRIPIIALTAHAMKEDQEKCMEAGCDDYASKPIDKRVLVEKCAAALGIVVPPGA